jgi:uncharacterized membrane protein (DUF106 family)
LGFTDFLDPVLDPTLALHPFLTIFIISFVITLLITLVYKYTTDQKRMKELKDKLKASQARVKVVSKTDPGKAMELQKDMLSINGEYMKHSFKSTLYTLIPVLFIFTWLSGNLAYEPIVPGEQFSVTAQFAQGHGPQATLTAIPELEILGNQTMSITDGSAVWNLRGAEGEYKLVLDYNNETYDANILITSGNKYIDPNHRFEGSKLQSMTVSNERVYPIEFGNFKINWFWTYFLISIALSIGIRKLLKVY